MHSSNKMDMLRLQKAQAMKQVSRADKLQKLLDSPDFREVIVDGFCESEVARYMFASTNDAFKPEMREDFINRARSGSFLRRWMDEQIADGMQKAHAIETLDASIEQLLREQAHGITDNDDLLAVEKSTYVE